MRRDSKRFAQISQPENLFITSLNPHIKRNFISRSRNFKKFRDYNQLRKNRLSTQRTFEHLGLVGPKCEKEKLSETYFYENPGVPVLD